MLQDKNEKRTPLEELGEFALIKHLTKDFKPTRPSTVKGIGDDATVLDFKGSKTVISTDLLIEGVHFDLTYMPLKHLGYKSVIVNLSDICAMNAMPTQVVVGLGLAADHRRLAGVARRRMMKASARKRPREQAMSQRMTCTEQFSSTTLPEQHRRRSEKAFYSHYSSKLPLQKSLHT